MANLKEVRTRIASTQSTQQITKAMKMVSATKLRKAQQAITQMRPYADKLNGILQNLSDSARDEPVNCIAPGPVKTKLAMAVHTEDIIEAYHDAIPLNRYGTEQEIANGIYFLASEKASYITGQILAVDGGFEATGVGLPSLRK